MTLASMIGTKREDVIVLKKVLCIHHLVQFVTGGKEVIRLLINSSSEINAITPAYAKELGLQICQTNVGSQKIDSLSLVIFEMIIAGF